MADDPTTELFSRTGTSKCPARSYTPSALPTAPVGDRVRAVIERGEPVDELAEYTRATFPRGTAWRKPDGYPNSLGLCILDAIWSIGVHYDRHVVPVLNRYRDFERTFGLDPNVSTPRDLAKAIDRCGGSEGFARDVASRHRTSSTNGILKADAVRQAAQLLCEVGVLTPSNLAAHKEDVKPGWHRIRGQRSGVSWKYLLMLAGVDGIKPDRRIHAFITSATGLKVTNDVAIQWLTEVQQSWPPPRPSLLELDYAIWRHQSGRPTD